MQFQLYLRELAASRWLRAALPVFLAGLFCLLALNSSKNLEFGLDCLGTGSFLLTGIYDQGVAFDMPLYYTLVAFWLNLGGGASLFFLAAYFGTYLLVFCAGALLRGYRAGIASMAAACLFEKLGGFSYGTEQAFYSFLLLLALALLLLDRGRNTVKSSLLAGLAVGFTILARTPLFLFPPVYVLCGWLWAGDRSRAFALRCLVFLAAAYALLVPWGAVRYPITGKFSLFDERRAAPNVISSARFTVFNMEANSRRVAGIGEGDSAIDFFMREVTASPSLYALTVLRRLWQVILFDPLLFGLLLVALLAGRGRERRLAFALPVYFILIHAALAIEKRYFYPLMYVIPPLLAATFWPVRTDGGPGRAVPAGKAVMALFWLSFCAVLAVEGLILAYPYRSARNTAGYEGLSLALRRWPNDSVIQRLGCEELMRKGDYAGFYECLEGYSKKFDDKVRGYFLLARASGSPAGIPLPRDPEMGCLIIRMLREFELGQQAAAGLSYSLAYGQYETHFNTLNGEGYAMDREVLKFMRQDSRSFWERYVYEQLLLWPPERISKILAGMKRHTPLTARLRLLEYAVGRKSASGGVLSRMASGRIFRPLAQEILGAAAGSLRLLPGKVGGGRPAAEVYLRALGSPWAEDTLLRGWASEEELYKLLILRDTKPAGRASAAASVMGRLYKKPLYHAFRAVFSQQSGAAAELEESLDDLESGLKSDPVTLSLLAAYESGTGGSKARRLEAMAQNHAPAVRKPVRAEEERSGILSDSAVEKMRAGDYEAALGLLLKAVKLNRVNSGALMNLCTVYLRQGKKEQALAACRNAAQAVYSDAANSMPGLEALACDATYESYRLLKELGRPAEAREALKEAVEKAPVSWPGLAGAKKELAARE